MSKKIFQRAIAKNLVYDTGDTIKLLNKYEPVRNDISYKQLLDTVQKNLEHNPEFAKEYTELLVRKKRISDYNQDHHNFITAAITGAIALTSGIINSVSRSKERDLEQDKLATANTQTVMSMMMQEEASKVSKAQQDNMLIISAIAGMVVVTGLIIYTKK